MSLFFDIASFDIFDFDKKTWSPFNLVSLVCSGTAMTVTLNTVDGFEGKIYSAKKPKKCTARGIGKTETRCRCYKNVFFCPADEARSQSLDHELQR
jgi:hypothetical protein